MNEYYVIADMPSTTMICYVNGAKTTYPSTWPKKIPGQKQVHSIAEIIEFAKENNCTEYMFSFYDPGKIPARSVPIDSEKAEKAFRTLLKYGGLQDGR